MRHHHLCWQHHEATPTSHVIGLVGGGVVAMVIVLRQQHAGVSAMSSLPTWIVESTERVTLKNLIGSRERGIVKFSDPLTFDPPLIFHQTPEFQN